MNPATDAGRSLVTAGLADLADLAGLFCALCCGLVTFGWGCGCDLETIFNIDLPELHPSVSTALDSRLDFVGPCL